MIWSTQQGYHGYSFQLSIIELIFTVARKTLKYSKHIIAIEAGDKIRTSCFFTFFSIRRSCWKKSWIIAREQSCDLSNRAHHHDSPFAGCRRCFVIDSKFPSVLIIEMLAVTQCRIHYLKLYIAYVHHRCYINCDTVNGMDFCSYGSVFFNRGTLTNIERNISCEQIKIPNDRSGMVPSDYVFRVVEVMEHTYAFPFAFLIFCINC